MSKSKHQIVLIILDGWGLGRRDESNPIHVVQPQNFKWLEENFPVTSLQASGISVGLPWGETGNSEVGHLTLGAGKVLYQYFPKITMAIKDKSFFENAALKNAFSHAKKNNSSVNLVGLLSKGNVHASLEHLLALIKMGDQEGANIKLHLFSDGKDVAPKTIYSFLEQIPQDKIATITGRYYAMDRNHNWQLTQKAYENLVGESGATIENIADARGIIEENLKRNPTEEYLSPIQVRGAGSIKDGDSVIFFNYREDSIRQLAESFISEDFDKFPTKKFGNLYIATFTHYEEKFGVPVAFPADTVKKPLGAVLSDAGKTQLRIAETYKYAHITYFFNGYQEPPYKNEFRVLIPSLTTSKPEEHPELQAIAITDRLLEAVEGKAFDFVLVNYANPDTIAHTANYDASIESVRAIDREMGRLLKVALNDETTLIITSDHGNVEEMINPVTALPESQHDPNPVPFYLVSQRFKGKKFLNWKNLRGETMGSLADAAPTILEIMGLKKPEEMTGRSLLEGLI